MQAGPEVSSLIDTNIAIFIMNGAEEVLQRLSALSSMPLISLVSRIELEGGVFAETDAVARRRERVDALLKRLAVLPCDEEVVVAYADIVSVLGFSRRRVFDRLIAATALVNDLTLVTANGLDFRRVPGLKLEVWPAPAQ